MTSKKTKVQPIIKYIDDLAELYSKRAKPLSELEQAKEDKNEDKITELNTEIDKINKEITDYQTKNGNKQAKFSDIEEAFAYQVNTTSYLNTNTAKMIQSELQVLTNLLKQNGTISNSAYESINKQYRAIIRDYHMSEEE